jgi:hypothetical protein
MILFKDEGDIEEVEVDLTDCKDLVIERLVKAGEKKAKEVLHRNKRLRTWPSEHARGLVYQEILTQAHGVPPSREAIEIWKAEKAEEFWDRSTRNLPIETREYILREFGMSYISNLVANAIHLESLYTTLKPIGEKQWELSPQNIRESVHEDQLAAITENKEIRQGKFSLPNWIKGAIIFLSLQSSKNGRLALSEKNKSVPHSDSIKEATNWCLGNHISIGGKKKSLVETTEVFNKWQENRKKINLHLVKIPIEEIPEEVPVPDPEIDGKRTPWGPTWKILPIKEEEIRMLGEKVLANRNYQISIGNIYKKKLFDRWTSSVMRRSYIRTYEASQPVSDRWKTRTLIFNPINLYIPTRITFECPELRIIAKTETTWSRVTDNLPEPEVY